ncbi:hypothetical protein FANTH_6115 [Fusarium anthophilum]|uniref:Secreted protein n=1 Tax=Fusarium anthophilum TaxID=48485 RepID=A0A8H5E591_9HYPO|nr:hypothetical protein FANTH_6115 [Fusarium anthophilum]
MLARDWPTALALILHFALLELSPSQTNAEHRDMPRIMDEELLAHLPILSSSSKTPPSVWSHALPPPPPPPLSMAASVSLTKYLAELTARYSMSVLVTAASFGACRLHREPTEMENASRL